MGKRLEINTGDRYNMLTVIREVEPYQSPSGYQRRRVLCKCDCGNETIPVLTKVKNNVTKSCGCDQSSYKVTHGLSKTKVYDVWIQMKQRCYNPNNKDYHQYGGRGIIVCDRWINSFENFIEDMGERPNGLTLERDNVDGNYTPENCSWVTWTEQANNKRNSKVTCLQE